MSQRGSGRIIAQGRAKTRFISVPSGVVTDSTWPFEDGEEVVVRIDAENRRVIIEKMD